MSIDSVTDALFDDDDDILELQKQWLVKQGFWNGRPITWEEGPEVTFQIAQNILKHLFSLGEDTPEFEQFAARLAYLGGDAQLRAELEPLLNPPAAHCKRRSLTHKIKHFWKKHKTEILVGVGVIGVIAVGILLTPAAGATVASALPILGNSDAAPPPTSHPTRGPQIDFQPKGALVEQSFLPYEEMVKRSNLEKLFPTLPSSLTPSSTPFSAPAWSTTLAEHSRTELTARLNPTPQLQSSPPLLGHSRNFSLPAPHPSPHKIGGINGIANSPTDVHSNMTYLRTFAPNTALDWVYNASHTSPVDVAEAFLVNYNGLSPNTGRYLRDNILAFHEEHRDNPGVKYLQICHSKGAIDVYNTLSSLPEEARKRVIVLAIAPAKVVPEEMCYRAYNYASKKDIVPTCEVAHAGFLSSEENLDGYQMALANHEELELLEPHPDATGIDHEFQSPTFRSKITDHIADYLKVNGNYP